LFSAKLLQLNLHGKDGLEKVVGLIIITLTFTTGVGFPVAIIQTHYDGPFHRFFNAKQIGGGLWSNIAICTILYYQLTVDSLSIIIMGVLILVHTNAMKNWITICTNEL